MTQNRGLTARKKLLVLSSTFPRWKGDDEPAFVFDLCRRLAASFDVVVLAPHAPGAKTREFMGELTVVRFRYFFELGERLAYRGGILANLRNNRLLYLLVPLFFSCQFAALFRLLTREKIDVIHAHWLIPQGLVAVAARKINRAPPALLCTSHGSDLLGLPGKLFTAIKNLVIRQSDAISVVSHAMKNYAISLGNDPAKIRVIPMGIDTANRFVPTAASRRNNELLFVGRLTRQKGLDVLIRALAQVRKTFPDITLTVVGQGPEEDNLRRISKELGVAESVEFIGPRPNEQLPELLGRATLLVFPSVAQEGFGLVCAEALACECPVISSNLQATLEIVQDGKTGLLFRPDDTSDLSRKILALLSAPETRRQMGRAGRLFVSEHFDSKHIADRYRDLLDSTS